MSVKKFKDARSPVLKVAVDRPAIDIAIRNDSRHCLIAEAIKLAYPKFTHISVDLQTIRFSDPEKKIFGTSI